MDFTEKAAAYFTGGFNCAQAVLAAFAPELGIDEEKCFRMASGLGAGLGYRGEMCGAVVGAYLVIGLKYGFSVPDDLEKREKTTKTIDDFVKKFEKRNGSVICKELLKIDLSDPEQLKYAREISVFRDQKYCPKYIADSSEFLSEMLF